MCNSIPAQFDKIFFVSLGNWGTMGRKWGNNPTHLPQGTLQKAESENDAGKRSAPVSLNPLLGAAQGTLTLRAPSSTPPSSLTRSESSWHTTQRRLIECSGWWQLCLVIPGLPGTPATTRNIQSFGPTRGERKKEAEATADEVGITCCWPNVSATNDEIVSL